MAKRADERRCIFCLRVPTTEPFSIEHIFPEAIGGTLTVRDVCQSCNSLLGREVDALLTDNVLIQFKRHLLGLAGKGGRIPNPLQRATLASDPNVHVRYSHRDSDADPEVRVLQRVRRVSTQDGELFELTLDASEKGKAVDIVNLARERAGMPPLSREAVETQLAETTVEAPELHVAAKVDTSRYKRAVLKIAYELACLWLGQRYLEDPMSELLRGCVLDGGRPGGPSSNPPGRIELGTLVDPLSLWSRYPDEHIGFLWTDRTNVVCCVKLFEVVSAVVCVSQDASRYQPIDNYFVAIDVTSGSRREGTLEQELSWLGAADLSEPG